MTDLNRRQWLASSSALAAGALLGPATLANDSKLPEPTPQKLPRWRGFNLLSMFLKDWPQGPFPEKDFEIVSSLGFDFVRLPLDYRYWVDPADWMKVREEALEPIDNAVAYGKKHGVHVQINFHRAPGFTVASPPEPKSLWTDPEALDACAAHWAHFARRYKDHPNRLVSFNLVNEPTNQVSPGQHRKVVERLVGVIREESPVRLIVCDGRGWARTPIDELVGLNVAGSFHGYEPMGVTHYKASWVEGSDKWPEPTWPLRKDGETTDRAALGAIVKNWKKLEAKGIGVHVGEFGCHNRTPHPVVLAWMADCLSLWKEAGWGWALWNLRGSFGLLDSERSDVAYEDYMGHKLDRKMLEVLRLG
jgi:endoglucanase